jgi:hypothetical protein
LFGFVVLAYVSLLLALFAAGFVLRLQKQVQVLAVSLCRLYRTRFSGQ